MRIGLVFDGGGAKGAYQIGVWQALCELELVKQVTAIAGTSIGGLNAALFVQGDFNKAYKIWTNDIQNIRKMRIQMDLSELIDKHIDVSVFGRSNIDCYLACKSTTRNPESFTYNPNGIIEKYMKDKIDYFNLRTVSPKDCRYYLGNCTVHKALMLATSALPLLCHRVKIDNNFYKDGGVGAGKDNSPVYPLAQKQTNCDTIITIHLNQTEFINKSEYPNTKIYELVPNIPPDKLNLFKQIEFDTLYTNYMINAGYRDSIACLKTLKDNNNKAIEEDRIDNERQKPKQYKYGNLLRNSLSYYKGGGNNG